MVWLDLSSGGDPEDAGEAWSTAGGQVDLQPRQHTQRLWFACIHLQQPRSSARAGSSLLLM